MEQVLQQFCLDGTPVSCEPFGNGHINRTFRVTCSSGRVYTLQRINRVAFRHPEELIENIDAVSRFIAKKNTGLEMIRLCTARDGRKYAVDAQGEFWRAYDYISGGLSLEAPRDCNDFYQAAVAFGKFQQALADFPAATLHETIPRFHDTEDRLCQLRASVEADACSRVREAGPELAFISAREQELGTLCRMLRSGALPLRVTHNDTKLNNVLLDEKTGLARSVLDLDTVMPGLSAYDFGDAVRFGASSAAEDETDLSKVFLRLDLYRAFLEGYLDACGHALTENEISVLPLGAKIITIELGMRFLKDYLDGDVYFKIDRPTQNLDRAARSAARGGQECAMAADAADPAGNGRLPLPDITFLSLFHRQKIPLRGSQRRRGLFLLTAHRRGGSAKTARKAHGLCSFPDGAFRGRKSARQKVRTATSRADQKIRP